MEWKNSVGSYDLMNYIYDISDIENPNKTIRENYEQLKLNKSTLTDLKNTISDLIMEDDDLLVVLHEIEEIKLKLKPLQDIKKAKVDELRVKHSKLFLQESQIKKNIERCQFNITRAVLKKQENEDDSPIIITDDNGKDKKLVIKMNPKMKTQKPDA